MYFLVNKIMIESLADFDLIPIRVRFDPRPVPSFKTLPQIKAFTAV